MVQNFVENMMGSNGLIFAAHSRTQTRVPSSWCSRFGRDAETRYRAQEEALQQKVSTTEASLRALQGQGGPEGTAAVGQPRCFRSSSRLRSTNWRRDLGRNPHRLRQVQANLSKTLKVSATLLAFLNIALVPLMLSVASIAMAFVRSPAGAPEQRI